jgi:phosphate starvation-inducible protein PhoH
MAAKRAPNNHDAVVDYNVASKQTQALKLTHAMLNQIAPLTENQAKLIRDYKIGSYFMALLGSAGSGKTFLSMALSLDDVLRRDTPFEKLVIIRSAVDSRSIGFLPGSLDEKSAVYEMPYKQICADLFNRGDAFERLKEQKHIEFNTTSYLRGTTFNNAIVLIDEVQNMTFHELNTIITRIGHESKAIFVGDATQSDLTQKHHDVSGLTKFLDIAYTMPEFSLHIFSTDDCVRSGLVKNWIIACEAEKAQHHDRRC